MIDNQRVEYMIRWVDELGYYLLLITTMQNIILISK